MLSINNFLLNINNYKILIISMSACICFLLTFFSLSVCIYFDFVSLTTFDLDPGVITYCNHDVTVFSIASSQSGGRWLAFKLWVNYMHGTQHSGSIGNVEYVLGPMWMLFTTNVTGCLSKWILWNDYESSMFIAEIERSFWWFDTLDTTKYDWIGIKEIWFWECSDYPVSAVC